MTKTRRINARANLPKSDRDDDARLIEGCLSGSQDAWNEFYVRHDSLIRVVARRQCPTMMGHAHEDLVQTVYLKLLKSLKGYESRQSSLRTFVGMVSKRACVDHLRQISAAARSAKTEPIDHHDGGEEGALRLMSPGHGPDESLERAQEADLVNLAISRLKVGCRNLLRLRYFLELPYKKIAEMLGKKEHAVNVQTIRCLAQLKANYDDLVRKGIEA
ncbi:RNA polymerase sigma factor [Thermodesulfobacteriota bacterium]